MDLFNQFSSKQASETRAGAGGALDWDGLIARLAAAHATRQILAARDCHSPSGSFAPALAPFVTAHLAGASSTGHRPDELENTINQASPAGTQANRIETRSSTIDSDVYSDVNQFAKADRKLPTPIGTTATARTR